MEIPVVNPVTDPMELSSSDIIYVLSAPMAPWYEYDVTCNKDDKSILVTCNKYHRLPFKLPFQIPKDAYSVMLKVQDGAEGGESSKLVVDSFVTSFPRLMINNSEKCRFFAKNRYTMYDETSDDVFYVNQHIGGPAFLPPLREFYTDENGEKNVFTICGSTCGIPGYMFDFIRQAGTSNSDLCRAGSLLIDGGSCDAYGVMHNCNDIDKCALDEADDCIYAEPGEKILGILHDRLVILGSDGKISICDRKREHYDGEYVTTKLATIDTSSVDILDYDDHTMIFNCNAVTTDSIILNSNEIVPGCKDDDTYVYVIRIKDLLHHFVGYLATEGWDVPRQSKVPYRKFKCVLNTTEWESRADFCEDADEAGAVEEESLKRYKSFEELVVNIMDAKIPDGTFDVEYH